MKFWKWFKGSIWLDQVIWLSWGVCYAFVFPTYNLSGLSWVAFIPVLVYSYFRPVHMTVFYSAVYGLVFYFLAFFWLYGFWTPSLFYVLPLYTVFGSFFFLVIAVIARGLPRWRWVLVPAVFVSLELFRALGFHGFQWNMLGDSQFQNIWLIQSADLFGVYGISFLIILVNALGAEWAISVWRNGVRKSATPELLKHTVIVGVIFGLNLVYGMITAHYYDSVSRKSPQEKLVLMQPNMASREPWFDRLWANYGIFWKLHAEAALENPDMIVWSETMVKNLVWHYLSTYPLDSEINQFNLRCLNFAREVNIPILFTCPDKQNGQYYNTAEYLDPAKPYYLYVTNRYPSGQVVVVPNRDVVHQNAKIHLVPFGEWMPVYDELPVVKKIIEIEGAGAFMPSTNFTVLQGRKSRFRVLVCYEDLFALLARQFIAKGVNYFINDTNDGWAWKLGLKHPMWQHLAGSTMTAVSVRRPIARAANTGVTGIIDLTGRFKGNIGDYQRGFYTGYVSLIPENLVSIYTRFGFVFPYLALLAALAGFGLAGRKLLQNNER